jgi:uncharacterized repeat protein (TIGR01451 family)
VSEIWSAPLLSDGNVDAPGARKETTLTKLVDKPSVKRGELVTYTLTLSNQSNRTATGVKLTDNLPTGVSFVEVIPSQGSFTGNEWEVGTLAANSSATLILKVKVD